MKLYWSKEVKRLGASLVLFGLIGMLLCNLVISRYRAAVNLEYNQAIAALLGSVIEAYPETSEDALIRVLNGQGAVEPGEKILEKYGVFVEAPSFVFTGQESNINDLYLCLNLLIFVLLLSFLAIFFFYLSRRQERIFTLCRYMEELSRGNYGLDIRDSGDDELSGLKSEVYKLTVVFREQAQRAVANKAALADSVADISHQLKTPLTSVMVLVDNLCENEDMDGVTRQRFLSEISRQISGVTWLVATLLKLSRLDAGVVELENKPLQLRDLAEEVCGKLELNAEWYQVELYADIPDTIRISGDGKWISEALLNVVKNAIEHSQAGSVVKLSAEENDVYTMLAVHNFGEEIPQEEQKHLFERFYRGGLAGADSTGIGLALAKEIIVRQGGYISVESSKEKGTTFCMKFLKVK